MPNDHPSPELHDAILATAREGDLASVVCRLTTVVTSRGLCWRPSCTVVVLVLHRET